MEGCHKPSIYKKHSICKAQLSKAQQNEVCLYMLCFIHCSIQGSNCPKFGQCEILQVDPCIHTIPVVLIALLLSGIARGIRLIWYISCPRPRISHFFQGTPLPFVEKWLSETMISTGDAHFYQTVIISMPSQ